MSENIKPMIYEAAAAEILGIPYRVLRNERYQGRISYLKVASRVMYTQDDLDEWRKSRETTDQPERIYFIQGAKGSPIKIGFTSWESVEQRMASLQSGNHEKLRLLCAVPGGLYFEKALHRLFAADRLVGEWFTCTPALLGLIETLKNGASLQDALSGVCPDNAH